MSLYNEQIDVRSTTGDAPALFSWRGTLYRVRRVIGTWRDADPAASAEVRLVRVAAESDHGHPGIADIVLDTATNHWTMRRLWH
ncbi:hypothetical protein FOF52_14225 [Thermobifida alba]|uniref:DUF6504 domain-containing protein n=1 Tax=Thermobifida alba TaxID=53522 RepID=A0ABY4L2T2_THEAE|nr:DUF6504 family protein [Thermobifida alba]UPT21976.1 hypothetical protein FOF52_14225 [Thermobifida alba]HLU99303.1 DUF6504 family protein [Thermobifida alba]